MTNVRGLNELKKQHFKRLFKRIHRIKCFVSIDTIINLDRTVDQRLKLYIPEQTDNFIGFVKVYSFFYCFVPALDDSVPADFEETRDEYFDLQVNSYGRKITITKLHEPPMLEDYRLLTP